MPILIVLTLVPTISFYFYVLVQFAMEANRRRHHDTCATIVPLHSLSEREEERILGSFEESRSRPVEEIHPVPVSRPGKGYDPTQAGSPARAAVVPTYLKNRITAYQAGTGRLAVKRAAKG